MIETGMIKVRPHIALDHNNDKVQALPERMRQQFCHCSEQERIEHQEQYIINSGGNGKQEVGIEEASQEEEAGSSYMPNCMETRILQLKSKLIKARGDFVKQEPELEGRLKSLLEHEFTEKKTCTKRLRY